VAKEIIADMTTKGIADGWEEKDVIGGVPGYWKSFDICYIVVPDGYTESNQRKITYKIGDKEEPYEVPEWCGISNLINSHQIRVVSRNLALRL
jgi:hypothetical protein